MFNDVILSKCVKDKYRHRYDNNPKFHVYADWKKKWNIILHQTKFKQLNANRVRIC